MLFLGVDLAWGSVNATGCAALDESGLVRDAGLLTGWEVVVDWIDGFEGDVCCFVDAPLVVLNPERSMRDAERQVGQRYGRWQVSANASNVAKRDLAGVDLRRALEQRGWRYSAGLTGPEPAGRTLSECYPYTALVGAAEFGYDLERPRYKRRPRALAPTEFRARRAEVCDELIRRLQRLVHADPPLDVGSHAETARLVSHPSPISDTAYKAREDLVDALICAWTAAFWHRHGLERCQVLGADDTLSDREGRVATIIAPARDEQRARAPRPRRVSRSRPASARSLLPTQLPIMQAPMGAAASPELVSAVAGAGGLGVYGAAWTPLPELGEVIAEIQRRVDRPFGVNLVLAFEQEDRLELALGAGVRVICFSWGVRRDLFERARAAGAYVIAQVPSSRTAREAADAGANALIAQGIEAGGHVEGEIGLLSLIREMHAAVSLPILAAGGIADEAGVRAAFSAGASGVSVGTRFAASDEAGTHPVYREQLVAATAGETVLTGLFDVGWPDGPHRVLRNSTYRAWVAAGRPASGARPGEGETVARIGDSEVPRYSMNLPAAAMTGDLEALALYAGQGVGLIERVEPAGDLVERLARGARA